jgi:hypothetical protein
MGSRNHPCCEKNVNQTAPVATVQQSQVVLHPIFPAVMLVVQKSGLPTRDAESHDLAPGIPPPSPPNLNSILRI